MSDVRAKGRSDDGGLRLGDLSGELCAVRVEPLRSCWGKQGDCQARYELSFRPRRAEPWFVEIGTPEGTSRFWFSLER
jgi:hypothetical protein